MFNKQQVDDKFFSYLTEKTTLYTKMIKRIPDDRISESYDSYVKIFGVKPTEEQQEAAYKYSLVEAYRAEFINITEALNKKYDNVLPQELYEITETSSELLTEMELRSGKPFHRFVINDSSGETQVIEERSASEWFGSAIGSIGGLVFAISTVSVWTLGAVFSVAAIPVSIYAAWALLMPDNTNMRWRKSIKKFSGELSGVFIGLIGLPNLSKSRNMDVILNDITLHRDVESKFKHNYDIKEALKAAVSVCETKTKVETKEAGGEINVRNKNAIMKVIANVRSALSIAPDPIDSIADYRTCVMTRIISLYQVLFLGVFVQYIEYDSAKKVITGSYETKLLFSQFKKLGKQDKKFQKQFEVLIQLRNLIGDYIELLEDTHVPNADKNDEVANKLSKQLNDADDDIEKAIRNNIDKLEIENAKQAFDSQIADLDVLAIHKDPYSKMKVVDDEKEEEDKYDKDKKSGGYKNPYNVV